VCPAGEYVAVEYIESVLGKTETVEQIWVYGSSFESVLVAVVVPKQPTLMAWAKEQVGTSEACTKWYGHHKQHSLYVQCLSGGASCRSCTLLAFGTALIQECNIWNAVQ
jgi:long-subunit acyl-CoA synthetase (AMP-forming)